MVNDQLTVVLHPDKWDSKSLHEAMNISEERFKELCDLAVEMLRTTKTKSESFAKISTRVANANELVLAVSAIFLIEHRQTMLHQQMEELFKRFKDKG
jgi:hypothetical protein